MKIRTLSATLVACGLLAAAPAFAQTTSGKQPTQEGGTSSAPSPSGGPYNANPNYKQPTQEGGTSFAPNPTGGAYNANPNYKQPTQEGGTSFMPAEKQK